MPRMPSWLLAVVILMLAAGVGISRMDLGSVPASSGDSTAGETTIWSPGRDGAAENADSHWEKHGSEFPEYHSVQEYKSGALKFIRTPPPGTLTKHRENGDTLYYDPATNTFAVADGDGEPRTMFRPDSGRAYWDRQ